MVDNKLLKVGDFAQQVNYTSGGFISWSPYGIIVSRIQDSRAVFLEGLLFLGTEVRFCEALTGFFLFSRYKFRYPPSLFYKRGIENEKKCAVVIWTIVAKNQVDVHPEDYFFLDEKRKLNLLKCIQKQSTKFVCTDEKIYIATN